jgi:hypothetical protein
MRTRPIPPTAPVLALMTALALVATACSGTAATAPPSSITPTSALSTSAASPAEAQPSVAPTATPTESPSETPSETASAAPSETASVEPSLPPLPSFVMPSFTSDKELEALLPDTYQGRKLTKFSISGEKLFNGTSQTSKDLAALLQSFGKGPADISYAFASDPGGQLKVTFGAYRIKGVQASTWAPALYTIAERDTIGTTVTDVDLGGKSVKKIVAPKGKPGYAWARGDVLFFVVAATDALAGPAIAVMP